MKRDLTVESVAKLKKLNTHELEMIFKINRIENQAGADCLLFKLLSGCIIALGQCA